MTSPGASQFSQFRLESAGVRNVQAEQTGNDELGKFYGQAERAISTGQLNTLLCLHLPPIKVVVFDRPSYAAAATLGDLISR